MKANISKSIYVELTTSLSISSLTRVCVPDLSPSLLTSLVLAIQSLHQIFNFPSALSI